MTDLTFKQLFKKNGGVLRFFSHSRAPVPIQFNKDVPRGLRDRVFDSPCFSYIIGWPPYLRAFIKKNSIGSLCTIIISIAMVGSNKVLFVSFFLEKGGFLLENCFPC